MRWRELPLIEKYERNIAQKYYNVLEKSVILAIDEYYSVLNKFGLYDEKTDTYNWRKLFWMFSGAFFAFTLLIPVYAAIGIFLFNHLR